MRAPELAVVRTAFGWYCLILSLLFATASVAALIQGGVLHQPYPRNTFLFDPSVRFSDFTIYYPRFSRFGHGLEFFNLPGHPFTYPAPCVYAFLIFIRCFSNPLLAYLLVVMAAVLIGALALYRTAARGTVEREDLAAVVGLTLFMSYPFLVLLDRANIEGVVWIFLCAGLAAFVREKFWWAGGLIALAAAMKLFPAILLLLLLAKRRYKEFVGSLIIGGVATLASLAGFGQGIPAANQAVIAGLDYFRESYVLNYRVREIGFDHSLFACLKQFLVFSGLNPTRFRAAIEASYLIYGTAVLIGFASLYWLRVRKMPVLNQFFVLTIAMILLPYVSVDYTLVHLYLPWGAFVVFLTQDVFSGRVRFSTRRALAFLVPCAILFAPESYLLTGPIGWGGQFKALVLVSLLVAAVRFPLPASLFQEFPGHDLN